MVNNRKIIERLMIFPNKDCFYFIQILQRKKDHKGTALGGSNNNSRLVKAYFIRSLEQLDVQWEEMVKLAEVFEARVSINLNPRNFRKAAFQTLQHIADQMSNDTYDKVHKAYTHVLGEYHSEMDKRWIVDLDEADLYMEDEIILHIMTEQDKLRHHTKAGGYEVLAVVPSKSGKHIITNPFDLSEWKDHYSVEIHKNNPTNLYIP